jgi:hypothetical protein
VIYTPFRPHLSGGLLGLGAVCVGDGAKFAIVDFGEHFYSGSFQFDCHIVSWFLSGLIAFDATIIAHCANSASIILHISLLPTRSRIPKILLRVFAPAITV